jgi:hypothetical protein
VVCSGKLPVVTESAPSLEDEEIRMARTMLTGMARELLTKAQVQEWRLGTHYKFVKDLGIRLGGVVGKAVCLVDDPSILEEPASDKVPFDAPCSSDLVAFSHTIDIDGDPDSELPEDPQLLDRAHALCGGCLAKDHCLEYSYAEPHLHPGLWGGLFQDERKAEWEIRAARRNEEIKGLYQDIAAHLIPFIKAHPEQHARSEFNNIFTALAQGLMPKSELFPEASCGPNVHYKRIAEICLNNPLIEERAYLLLGRFTGAILRSWVEAEREGVEVQYDHEWLATEGRVALKTAYLQSALPEQRAVDTVEALANGTFDYDKWYKHSTQNGEMNALVLLARIREPIPPEANLEELKRLAVERLDEVKRLKKQARDMLCDFYGLGAAPALEIEDMAEKYNKDAILIRKYLKVLARQLRQKLGRKDVPD